MVALTTVSVSLKPHQMVNDPYKTHISARTGRFFMTGSRVATRHSDKGKTQLNNMSSDLLLPAPKKLLDANDPTDQSAVPQDHCPVKDPH